MRTKKHSPPNLKNRGRNARKPNHELDSDGCLVDNKKHSPPDLKNRGTSTTKSDLEPDSGRHTMDTKKRSRPNFRKRGRNTGKPNRELDGEGCAMDTKKRSRPSPRNRGGNSRKAKRELDGEGCAMSLDTKLKLLISQYENRGIITAQPSLEPDSGSHAMDTNQHIPLLENMGTTIRQANGQPDSGRRAMDTKLKQVISPLKKTSTTTQANLGFNSEIRVNRFGTVCYVPIQEKMISFAEWAAADQVKWTNAGAFDLLDQNQNQIEHGFQSSPLIQEDHESQHHDQIDSAYHSQPTINIPAPSPKSPHEIEIENEVLKWLEKELYLHKTRTKTLRNRKLFEQQLTEEELLGKAFIDHLSIAELEETQAAKWDVEERDRQFDFARDMEAFLRSEFLWENTGCCWGGMVMVMLL